MGELTQTLPGSWYCSKPLYELERRGVFLKVSSTVSDCCTSADGGLKAWYLLGPVTRFQVGANLTGEIAQVEIEVARDSESTFHVFRRPDVCVLTLTK